MSGFDRVRPRTPRATGVPAATVGHDPQGKRALFSASSSWTDQPAGVGSVSVECSSCGARSVLTPGQALRASLFSVHLGIGVTHRNRTTSVSVTGRDYPSWMKCPSCGKRTWVRLKLIV